MEKCPRGKYVRRSGGKCPRWKCPGRVFFKEEIVRVGTARGGTVRMEVLSGEKLSWGNRPGGNLPVTISHSPNPPILVHLILILNLGT